jgi:hypothetical protein
MIKKRQTIFHEKSPPILPHHLHLPATKTLASIVAIGKGANDVSQ